MKHGSLVSQQIAFLSAEKRYRARGLWSDVFNLSSVSSKVTHIFPNAWGVSTCRSLSMNMIFDENCSVVSLHQITAFIEFR